MWNQTEDKKFRSVKYILTTHMNFQVVSKIKK